MPDPAPDPTPTYSNPALPRGWRGGTFEGHLAPLTPDFYDEAAHAHPEQVQLNTTWAPLEDLPEGDAAETWGLDPGGAGPGGGGGPRATETLSGAIVRLSSTLSGVVLDALPDTWLNTSRVHRIDLTGLGTGDVIEAQVETGRDGRRYLVAVRRLDAEPGA